MGKIRDFFRFSSRVHIREETEKSTRDLADLIDRFVNDGPMKYPFEWDDFLMWEHSDPVLEMRRREILEFEPLFNGTEKEKQEWLRQMRNYRERLLV